MNEDRLHTRVGVGVLLVLIALVAIVLGSEGRHLRSGMHVHVAMDRTGPLTEGAKVKISGRDIGSVDHIRLLPESKVVLDLWIDRRYAWMVRENSEFFVNQVGLLGEAYLEVGPARSAVHGDKQPAPPGPPLADGATVPGIDPPRLDRLAAIGYENLQAVMAMFKEGMPEASQLRKNLQELSATLDGIPPSPETFHDLAAARIRLWAEGAATYDWWKETTITPASMRALLARTRASIAAARAELSPLRAKIDMLTENITTLKTRLDPARFARFTQLLTQVDALTSRADKILAQVDAIAALVDRGEGTIGAFLHDTEIADDFKEMTKELMKQPWKTVGHPQ